MTTDMSEECAVDLAQAHKLMTEALLILDRHQHTAAAYLDFAIVQLGLREDGEGMPAA